MPVPNPSLPRRSPILMEAIEGSSCRSVAQRPIFPPSRADRPPVAARP